MVSQGQKTLAGFLPSPAAGGEGGREGTVAIPRLLLGTGAVALCEAGILVGLQRPASDEGETVLRKLEGWNLSCGPEEAKPSSSPRI